VTGHHVGMKCPALRSHQMHVKLSLSSYLDILQRLPVAPIDDITSLEGGIYPTFIHVLGVAQPVKTTPSLTNDCLYICELYKHSQANLGKWLVDTQRIARYVERMRIFVYTTSVHSISTRPAITVTGKRTQPTANVDYHVEQLRLIHASRKKGGGSWLDSRIARITGTSAALVMTGKKVTGVGMKRMFGLSSFSPTVPMKVGTILEGKILQAYCTTQNLTLNTPKSLVLGDKDYIGHTPDGITSYPHREVLEVKVIFSKKSIQSMLNLHLHQLQLGLLVHKCRKGRLLVYVAPSQMTEYEASTHIVDCADLEVRTFQKDDNWVDLFTEKSLEFYTNHLMWFYSPNFNTDEAFKFVTSLLMNNAKDTARASKKRKIK
jgi:hypothetical protein